MSGAGDIAVAALFPAIEANARAHPERVALWSGRAGAWTGVSYGALLDQALRIAECVAADTDPDAVVPLYLARAPGAVAAMLGCLAAGRTFACLNQKLRVPQLAAVVRSAGARRVVTDGAGAVILARSPGDDFALDSLRWSLLAGDEPPAYQLKAIDRLRSAAPVDDWPGDALPRQVVNDAPPHPDTAACCLFTSGSTGTPKGVLISACDLYARAEAERRWYALTETDVLMNILPFSFDVGLNQVLSGLLSGCAIVLLDSWLPDDVHRAAAERGVTGISGVPAVWRDMIATDMGFDTQGEHAGLRFITVSGGDLAAADLDRLPALAGDAGIYKTYGQTEAFRAASLAPHEFAARPRSVGRPFGGARVYVVREDGTPAEHGQVGEVVHTGLGVMLGYLGGDDPVQKRRANPFLGEDDPAPWAIFTGDQGHLDEEGYLFLAGRRDAMMKIAGNRVYPGEVVEQLLALDGVEQAEVVGVKGADGETTLVAFVAGAPDLDEMLVRRGMSERVPSYMVPRRVEVRAALPRTASGKSDRPLLLGEAERLLADEAAAG